MKLQENVHANIPVGGPVPWSEVPRVQAAIKHIAYHKPSDNCITCCHVNYGFAISSPDTSDCVFFSWRILQAVLGSNKKKWNEMVLSSFITKWTVIHYT